MRHLLTTIDEKIEWIKATVLIDGNELADKPVKEGLANQQMKTSYQKSTKIYRKIKFRMKTENS